MNEISKEDIEFLDMFFEDELSEDALKTLDEKLKNPEFKAYYTHRLNQKFNKPISRLIIAYLPLILMTLMVIIGIILILK